MDNNNSALESLPLDELQAQYSYWNTKSAVIEQALSDARNRQREKMGQLNQVVNNLSAIMSRSEQLDMILKRLMKIWRMVRDEEMDIAKMIEELGKTVNPQEDQLSALESEHNKLIIHGY